MVYPSARLLFLAATFCSATLAGAADNVAPEYAAPAENPLFHTGGAAEEVNLRTLFHDPDVTGSAVRVSVRIGSATKTFDLALFDQTKPITVANFLQYVSSGRYASNFFHRSVPAFVVQGGGFRWNGDSVEAVPTFPTIQNEPGISNLRGTVAMAKLGGDPNSASSQWFVNLADNSTNLDAQNGGFTVFGRVLGTGMNVVDEVAALQVINAGSPFDSLPVKDYVTGTSIQRVHTVETNVAVIPTLSFAAISSAPDILAVTVTGSQLRMTPAANAAGPVTVTITATDLDGATTQGVLSLNVYSPITGWHTESSGTGQFLGVFYNPADSDTFNPSAAAVPYGSIGIGVSTSKSFTIRNDNTDPINGLSVVPTGANASDFMVSGGKTPLQPGDTATFTVTFKPGAVGARTAQLHVTDADGQVGAFDIGVTGTGLPVLTPSSVLPQALDASDDGTAEIPDWRTLVVASDAAAEQNLTQSPAPGTTKTLGVYPLVFSATNSAGVTATVQTTLTVKFARVAAPRISLAYGSPQAAVPDEGSAGLPPNSILTSYGTPALSNHRELAARVTIAANSARFAAIYWENAARESKLIARQGQLADVPNAPAATFKNFLDPLLSPSGAIAFVATLSGVKPGEDQGVWTDLFGPRQLVLREGAALPGIPGFRLKSVTSISLEDDAMLALVKLMPGAGVVPAVSDTALLRVTGPAASVILARTGTPFQNSKIKQLSVLQPAVHAMGQGRWEGSTGAIARLTLQDKRSLVVRLNNDGTPVPLIQAGAVDPNFPARLATLNLPTAGGQGVAVLASKAGVNATLDSAILYSGDGSSFTEAARENETTLLPGAPKFAGFWDPVANDQGALLFFASLRGAAPGGTNLGALWLKTSPTTLQVVARLGSPARDKDGIALPDANWSAFTSVALPDGPASGPIFLAQLSGKGATPDKKTGLWAVDSAGKTRLLLRTGDDINYPNGKAERVASITALNALPGSFGARRSYNAAGSVAVRVVFKDLSTAILRLDIP